MTIEKHFLPYNFCCLPPEFSSYPSSKIVIFPVPYDGTTSYHSGTREGPKAIIMASRFLELFDEAFNRELHQVGIHTLDELEPDVSGPEATIRQVREVTSYHLQQNKTVLMLGGEHSLSNGAARAFYDHFTGVSVLQLDAHADLRDSYQNSLFSHASVMRRIREFAPTLQMGVRSCSKGEAEFIRQNLIPVLWASEITASDKWKREICSSLTENVYVTIDLDVFDPSIMPSVGTPEPGGLGWFQVLEILDFVSKQKRIIGADLMELSPIPGLSAPDFLAAKLALKLIGYIFQNRESLDEERT